MMEAVFRQIWWLVGGPRSRPALWVFIPGLLVTVICQIALYKFTGVRGIDAILIAWGFGMATALALNYAHNALNRLEPPLEPMEDDDDDTLY